MYFFDTQGSYENGYLKTRRWGGKMLKSIESSVWCVGWTWFDVRCIPLILENVLHTHNMVFRPTENFLAASEGPTFVKISTFYHVFGASTPPSRVSIKYQKRSSLRFLLQKIISGYHTGSKITSVYSLDLREHVRYYNISRTVIEHFLKRSEFSKISKSNFLEQIHCIFVLWGLKNL